MNRTIYVAGVNRKHLAAAVEHIPYWLLSVTLLRRYPSWLSQYMTKHRKVRWDPGTFSDDPVSYSTYRSFIDRYVRSQDEYFQYDEIGDHESTAWYLKDMRRKGYSPIPILQPGGDESMMWTEDQLGIGSLVMMNDQERILYLNHLFYDVPELETFAHCHLLGMKNHEWFSPYYSAFEGDNTTWVRGAQYKENPGILNEYGEQWIPFKAREFVQLAIGF